MDRRINEMLEEEIKAEIKDLPALQTGSEEKSKAIEDLTKLYKLDIEEMKIHSDEEERFYEERAKKNQLSEQTKDRYFRLGIAAAELVLPLIFYGVWMRRGFKFEENGAYTSTTFKNLFNRFKPTKK